MPRAPQFPAARTRRLGQRGSLLIAAMLIATVIALGLAGYIALGYTPLKLAHRTFLAGDATNLAEAGLEDAIYRFKLVAGGMDVPTAWAGWALVDANATRTLPPFNRDQNAIGVVRVHVRGYDGSEPAPIVYSQAVVTPLDGGAPIVKTVRISLKFNRGVAAHGLVGLSGLSLKGGTIADSFNSNPTASPTGPWRSYSSAIARAQTSVVVLTGALSVGSGKIYGNAYLGPGVAPPSANEVTGFIVRDYQASFPMPAYPTPASVSQSYDVGSAIPSTLPVAGHVPASDGRYYYFCSNTTISAVSIAAGTNVTIVGTTTSLGAGLSIAPGGSCFIYMDGTVNLSKGTDLNNSGWAGALQIFTTTRGECTMSNSTQITACLYAPFASLTAQGGSKSGMLVGYYVANVITTSGNMDFHYDEAFRATAAGMVAWLVDGWYELQGEADHAMARTATGNFLL